MLQGQCCPGLRGELLKPSLLQLLLWLLLPLWVLCCSGLLHVSQEPLLLQLLLLLL